MKRLILDTKVSYIWIFSCKSEKYIYYKTSQLLSYSKYRAQGQRPTGPLPRHSKDLYNGLPQAVIRLKSLKHRMNHPGHKHSNIPQGVETQPREKKVTVLLRWHQTAPQQLSKDENLTLLESHMPEYTHLKTYLAESMDLWMSASMRVPRAVHDEWKELQT